METVKSLRQSGYKVKIIHHRVREKQIFSGKFDERMGDSAKGGRTELFLISPEGIQVKAEAKCSPKDNYCRRTGVAICLGRALKELEYQERLQKIKPKTFEEGKPVLLQICDELAKRKFDELSKIATDEVTTKNIQRGLDFFKEVAEVFKDPSLIKDVKREGYLQ